MSNEQSKDQDPGGVTQNFLKLCYSQYMTNTYWKHMLGMVTHTLIPGAHEVEAEGVP